MNIFETAARKKFRFPSAAGDLTAEQLWDLPLHSTKKLDLDSIAIGINRDLKSVTEESFVQVKPDPRKGVLETKLDILKHVIAAKLGEAEAAKTAAERAGKRQKILEALATKQDKALEGKSEAELLKELEELDKAA